MIHDKLENIAIYRGLGPGFATAIDWFAAQDLPALAEGRIALDGERVYALVQRYSTEERSARSYETHRNYADIQLILAGREIIAYRQAEGLEPLSPYDEAKDFASWRLEGGLDLLLEAGDFSIFFPQDAHAPKIAPEKPAPVAKIVVKVRLD